MGTLEEIKRMQHEGKSENEIMSFLQGQGIPMDEIQESLAQAKIKQAVSDADVSDEQKITHSALSGQSMEPSLLTSQDSQTQEPFQQPEQEQIPEQVQQYQQVQGYQEQVQQYPSYDSYSINADTISEIADQIVAERISSLRNKIESALDVKALLDSKIDSLDARLQRIEKILDRLQLSILQKVGDYVTNVEDIKKELIETQKSFKSLLAQKSSSSSDFKELE